MTVTLPLQEMTVEEKLLVMEEIWDDLLHASAEIPSPSWHGDVLRARELRVQEGISVYSDWSQAKKRIREQIK